MNKVIFLALAGLFLWSCKGSEAKKEEVLHIEAEINYEGVATVIAEDAKKALGSELKAALQRGGVPEALAYCNINALAITDSVASRYNVTIKRATDKPRNPLNAATKQELVQLSNWRKIAAENTGQAVTSEEDAAQRHFYIPIKIDAFCLTCHGEPGTTLTTENHALIASKYPTDQAVGYKEGDLRGIWHITFAK